MNVNFGIDGNFECIKNNCDAVQEVRPELFKILPDIMAVTF